MTRVRFDVGNLCCHNSIGESRMNEANIVLIGTCRCCGRPVSLFDSDASPFLKDFGAGLIHISCENTDKDSSVVED
jgi:hypothetical protein